MLITGTLWIQFSVVILVFCFRRSFRIEHSVHCMLQDGYRSNIKLYHSQNTKHVISQLVFQIQIMTNYASFYGSGALSPARGPHPADKGLSSCL